MERRSSQDTGSPWQLEGGGQRNRKCAHSGPSQGKGAYGRLLTGYSNSDFHRRYQIRLPGEKAIVTTMNAFPLGTEPRPGQSHYT